MPSNHPFLEGGKIAVFGVSPKRKTFAAAVKTRLDQAGVKTFVIHPEATDGWYTDFESLPEKVESVYIATGKKNTPAIVDSLIGAGVKKIWLQTGAFNKDIVSSCKDAGLETYTGCLMMYIPNIGFPHSFHRFIHELFQGKK